MEEDVGCSAHIKSVILFVRKAEDAISCRQSHMT